MANNALAPNIDNVLSDYVYAGRKLKEQRTNNLLNPQVKTAMTLADLQALKGAPTQRTPTLGERVEGLSYAAGEGFKDQLEGFKQMLTTNPKDTLMAMYEGLKHVIQDPSILADMGKQAVSSPENFTRFLAQNLNPMDLANVLNKVGTMRELTVYHGTPHKFEEFDSSKIGSGTGSQHYGEGIYFAEDRKVGESYKLSTGKRTPATDEHISTDVENYTGRDELQDHAADRAVSHVFRNGEHEYLFDDGSIGVFDSYGRYTAHGPSTGHLYRVDLPDTMIEKMIHWDVPINQQSPYVKNALESIGIDTKSSAKAGPMARGQESYIKEAGIPGIIYKEGSGNSRNFVVFPGEEKNLKILGRQ